MVQDFWTAHPKRVEILKKNWETKSAAQIAVLIGEGCTRNQVIGKARRLNLPAKERNWGQMRPR